MSKIKYCVVCVLLWLSAVRRSLWLRPVGRQWHRSAVGSTPKWNCESPTGVLSALQVAAATTALLYPLSSHSCTPDYIFNFIHWKIVQKKKIYIHRENIYNLNSNYGTSVLVKGMSLKDVFFVKWKVKPSFYQSNLIALLSFSWQHIFTLRPSRECGYIHTHVHLTAFFSGQPE